MTGAFFGQIDLDTGKSYGKIMSMDYGTKRKRRMVLQNTITAVLLMVILPAAAQEASDTFHKKQSLPQFAHIVISNTAGIIRLKGYNGKEVVISAVRKGPDSEYLQIQDNSTEDRIELFPRYLQFGRGNVSVDFEIQVPQSLAYNLSLSSFSGSVDVSGVKGRIFAKNVRGDVSVKNVQGFIVASSVSGAVIGELNNAVEQNMLHFSSISGNIIVRAPKDLNATMDLSSHSGQLDTNFPIDIKTMRYGPGKSAHAVLGKGSQIVTIQTTYGKLSFIRK